MIRAARADDLAALAALSHEVHQLHLAAWPERYRDPSLAEIEARVAELLADPEVAILVAETDGDAVGYAVVRRVDAEGHTYAHPRRTAYVEQLGVRAAARRGGHGRALMQAAEAQARTWGAVAITLDVQQFNRDALGFYEALGYGVTTSRLGKRI